MCLQRLSRRRGQRAGRLRSSYEAIRLASAILMKLGTCFWKNSRTPSRPSLSQYCRSKLWCTHCFAYANWPFDSARKAATSNASVAPGTMTSRFAWIKLKDCAYCHSGKREKSSREGVSSGSSSVSSPSSSSGEDFGAADGDGALELEAAGFNTSNSVDLVVVVFFGTSILAFFTGGGAGVAGVYYG